MFSVASRIKLYIANLPPDQIFTTRDVVNFGRRNAVDLALYKFVRTNYIVRLARGVFKLNNPDITTPSIQEIAEIKAKSFGKSISDFGKICTFKSGLLKDRRYYPNHIKRVFRFYTNGCSSSFRYGEFTIKFIQACKRKMSLPSTKCGDLLKAVWFLGKSEKVFLRRKVFYLKSRLNYSERRDFWNRVRKLPAWIYELFFPK